MPMIRVPYAGSRGVVKDLSQHELDQGVWSDARNMRFLDGAFYQFFGHGQVYDNPVVTPYHVLPVITPAGQRYWLYAGKNKLYATTITGGVGVHTNLTRQTAGNDVDYNTVQNAWTSTTLSGIPVLNPGNEVDPPQRWDMNIANRAQTLDNWPAGVYCKAMRAHKTFLFALNVTKAMEGRLPYHVMWSSAAEPGAVPSTWDGGDPTNNAGSVDLAEGGDQIVDGMTLRDAFMIYKEGSAYRAEFIGGNSVFRFSKVSALSGAMNRNCIADLDGVHFVVSGSDVVIHDGQTVTQVLDKQARRALFQDMDTAYNDRTFVVKNPFLNEVFICYTAIGGTSPNKALVWNYKDKTVSYRDLPNVNHAAYGSVDNSIDGSWQADNDPWESDLTAWNGPDFTPNIARVMMASDIGKLYMLDASSSFDGVLPTSYVERRGMGYGEDEAIKTCRGIRLRVTGNVGETITVKIGSQADPFAEPAYTTMTHVIGKTIACDCFVSGRYLSVWIGSGTAYNFRVDSFDIDIRTAGKW